MKYLKIRTEVGTANSTFDIYYDTVSSGTIASLYDTGFPAVDLSNEVLDSGEGVTVSVPDNATSIIVSSYPNAFCTETSGVNDKYYTIPIGCMSYTVSANNGIFNYFYTDCNCNEVIETIDATYGYTEQTFCALQDTVSTGILTVTYNGECTPVTPTPTNTPTNTQTPTPTNTLTPTPTSTQTPPFYYYTGNIYACPNCNFVGSGLRTRSNTPIPIGDGMYYRFAGSPYSYQITETTTNQSYSYDFQLNSYVASTNCVESCIVSPTPTPTNTPTMTPTPSLTPPVEYYYYVVTKYDCNNSCAVVPPDLVGRSSVPLSTVDGMYRLIGSYTYIATNLITPSPSIFDIDLDTATNSDLDCSTACNPTFYYSYTVRLHADTIAATCGSPVVVVFSTSSTFAPGITLYSDDTVPTLLTGYRYVNSFLDGNIYNLGISTGVVGIDTGSDC